MAHVLVKKRYLKSNMSAVSCVLYYDMLCTQDFTFKYVSGLIFKGQIEPKAFTSIYILVNIILFKHFASSFELLTLGVCKTSCKDFCH